MLLCVALLLQGQAVKRQQQAQLTRYMGVAQTERRSQLLFMQKLATEKERKRLKQLLANAGFLHDNAVLWLMSLKYGIGLLVVLMLGVNELFENGTLVSSFAVTKYLCGFVIGANIPEWWLKLNADRARKLLRQATPDAIDLLVLCVESGLSLNKAFNRVAQHLMRQGSPLAEQFRMTAAELEMLNDRKQALANLSWRTGVAELNTLSSTLQMAERYGSPLADTLRQISEDARRQRALSLEEEAGKLPGKITLIQMTLIMFPMLVMVIAPVMSQLLDSLA
nr:type II secretion system F family protein [Thaumasiovibrio subtropicus]